jgi:hypothetical protein
LELLASLDRLIELGYTISKNLSCDGNVSPAFQSRVDDSLNGYSCCFLKVLLSRCAGVVAILTDGVLRVPTFLYSLETCLSRKIPVVLVHDPSSCSFPSEAEQPANIKKIFENIAITLIPDWSRFAWDKVVSQLEQKLVSFYVSDLHTFKLDRYFHRCFHQLQTREWTRNRFCSLSFIDEEGAPFEDIY